MAFKQPSQHPEYTPAPESAEQQPEFVDSKTQDILRAVNKEVKRAENYISDVADHYDITLTPEDISSLNSDNPQLDSMPSRVRDSLGALAVTLALLKEMAKTSEQGGENLRGTLNVVLQSANEELVKLDKYFSGELEYEPDVLRLIDFQKLQLNPIGKDPGAYMPLLLKTLQAAVQRGENFVRQALAEAEQASDVAAAEDLLEDWDDEPENVETASYAIGSKKKGGGSRVEGFSDMTPDMAPETAVKLRGVMSFVNDIETTFRFLQLADAEKQPSVSVENIQKLQQYAHGLVELEQKVPSALAPYVQDTRKRTDRLVDRVLKGEFVVLNEHGEALAEAEVQKILKA